MQNFINSDISLKGSMDHTRINPHNMKCQRFLSAIYLVDQNEAEITPTHGRKAKRFEMSDIFSNTIGMKHRS